MKIYPLYSSSKGNLFCLENNDTSILIDIGVSFKNICNALENIGKNINEISAILITHEHTDHVKGINMICKKTSIPIYTCTLTKEYLDKVLKENNIQSNIHPLEYNETFKINDIQITPYKTSHDAVQPCGYYITDGNSSISFATDLGYVSDEIMSYLNKSDYIVLESNYDNIMLEYGSYPFEIKKRIKGEFGHLSNNDSATVIREVLLNNRNTRFLMSHLSENNNTQAIAKDTIENVLIQNGFNNFNISFATQNVSYEEYLI